MPPATTTTMTTNDTIRGCNAHDDTDKFLVSESCLWHDVAAGQLNGSTLMETVLTTPMMHRRLVASSSSAVTNYQVQATHHHHLPFPFCNTLDTKLPPTKPSKLQYIPIHHDVPSSYYIPHPCLSYRRFDPISLAVFARNCGRRKAP